MAQRKPVIVANWKTNKRLAETNAFLDAIDGKLPSGEQVDMAIAGQNVFLYEMVQYLEHVDADVDIIAEDTFWADEGSYTGETSPAALADIGVKGTIIGHYERRKMFAETNGTVGLKVTAALRNDITPIIALAEDTDDYDVENVAMPPLAELTIALAGMPRERVPEVIIAYEPSWAIGATEAPTLEFIEHSAQVIRVSLAKLFSQEIADQVRIQYGGSVTVDNAREILELPNIDGLLVGRTALEADNYIKLTQIAADVWSTKE
jgi:triosephosphate isomerase